MTDKQQSGSNVIGSILKNPSTEEIKNMQWGVPQPNINQSGSQIGSSKRYPHFGEIDQLYERKPVHQIGQDGYHYHTQYSQVSAIETGFKKLKTNQIQILKQLKKEYEVLRNSSLDSRAAINHKAASESQSLVDSNSVSQSDAQSSIATKNRRSRQKRLEDKELQLASLQKKQLELMLNNSMKKIEELLHNQIDLKKNIIELKSKVQNGKMSESQYDIIIKRSKQNEDALQKNLQDYKRQNQSLRAKVKELILNVGNFEGSVNVKQVQLKKKEERIKILEEELHLEKNKYASLQLDLKKLKMEYELLQRSKNEQISLLLKNKSSIEEMAVSQKNYAIKKLKEELEVKEERYLILLNKFNKGNNAPIEAPVQAPVQKQEQKQYNKNLQKLIQALKEDKNQQNNESINLILNKLSELQQKPDQHLQLEIKNLRHELDMVKQSSTISQNQTDRSKETRQAINQYEQRIRQYQKIIQQQNIEKIYFMEDLKKLTKEFNNLKREKDELIREEKDLKATIDRLEQQNRRYRNEIDMIKNVNVDLTESQHQNKNLMVKLQHMNLRQIEINNIRNQFNKRIEDFRTRQQAYQEEIRVTKRQLHQQEFQVFKEHQQYELKIKLMKIEHENEVNRLQDQLQKSKKIHEIQKNDLLNQKIKLQRVLLDKNKEFEDHTQKVAINLKDKEINLQRVKSEQQLIIRREQERYIAEINHLRAKIDQLAAANERLLQQSHKYALIQQEIFELKKIVRMNRKLTDTVDHLWQVKETQYSNINEILKLLQN